MIRRILLGFDDSEAARHAFDHALEVARRFGAGLLVVSVVRVPEPSIGPEVEGVIDTSSRRIRKSFEGLTAAAANEGIEIETDILVGHPAEQIVHLAETRDIDLIVLGSGGTGRLKRLMLGSVSERVMRYAPCPVTIVR